MTSSIWLNDLASYSLQVAWLVGIGAVLARLFGLRIPTATLAYWQTLLLACLLLPVCQPWNESVNASFQSATQVILIPDLAKTANGDSVPEQRSRSLPIHKIVLMVLGSGIAVRGAWLVVGFSSLRRLRRKSSSLSAVLPCLDAAQERLGIRADFYASDKVRSPITFGLVHPVIILPLSVLKMEPHLQETIIYHELLHVRRRDWIYEVVEECIRAVLWFHPAVWWLIGRIQLSREQVVDQAVIQLTESREEYVEALLAVALAKTRTQFIPAPLFLRENLLKKRVAQIFKETAMTKRRLTYCLVTSSCVLLLAAGAAVRMFPLQARALGPGPRSDESTDEPIQVVKGGERLLHRAPVEYPGRALEKQVEGDVLLEISVDEHGLVPDARVLSGPDELRRAALQSVLHWHYAPQPGTNQVLLRFRLPKEGAFSGVVFEGRRYQVVHSQEEAGRIERAMKEIQEKLVDPSATAEDPAKLKRQLEELNKAREERILRWKSLQADRTEEAERIERAMKETQEKLADLSATAEDRARLIRQLEELKNARTQRILWWKSLEDGGEAVEYIERAIRETEDKLADASTTGEALAKLKRQHEELNNALTERFVEGGFGEQRAIDGTLKLAAIRTERFSETARDILFSRLGIHEGDLINDEVARRILETVSGVDEHFRALFQRGRDGAVTLVIVGP